MQVRLTASNGTVANASAFVKIGTKELPQTPKAPTNITANVISTKDQKSTITLNWTPADTFATKWIIAVNGVEIGYVTGNRTSLDLTDVDRTLDVELSITGVTSKMNSAIQVLPYLLNTSHLPFSRQQPIAGSYSSLNVSVDYSQA